jgi:deoxycytidylate deaminase
MTKPMPIMLPERYWRGDMWAMPAVMAARKSTCCKSKRGVAIYCGARLVIAESNSPPKGFRCGGDDACRASCNKVAVHAEERALLHWRPTFVGEYDLVHAKVGETGNLVTSGPPSCWQCSRMILDADIITRVWLNHAQGWAAYTPIDFHRLTLEHCGLPIVEI